jgi:hypothetical protein
MMAKMELPKINKAEIARVHRDRFLQKVRQGEMSADEFLLKICGVPAHRLQEMHALLPSL